MFTPELSDLAAHAAALLQQRGETVAVAEGSAGGLVSATLLSVPGASAYYLGGAVVYTRQASIAFMAGAVEAPHGMRGATEEFAVYLAESVRLRLGATWGIGEAGAAGPANPYGDPAGHGWIAISGPSSATRHVLTGVDERGSNMFAFTTAALALLIDSIEVA
jgi:nicotinamide-nucleotide amidase